jgi:hypothetical protein
MLGHIVYALVIVGSNGMETTVAQFQTRAQCVHEANLVIKQGPSAYCFPTNQVTQADMQRQLNAMLEIMQQFRREMEITQ